MPIDRKSLYLTFIYIDHLKNRKSKKNEWKY